MSLFFFCFKNAEEYGQNCVKFPLFSPSPNNVGFRSLRANTLCVCLLRYWRKVGGRGVDFQERVWSLVSPLVEKKTQGIFSQKRSRHAKFQQILSNLENRYGPACTEPFNCKVAHPGNSLSVRRRCPRPSLGIIVVSLVEDYEKFVACDVHQVFCSKSAGFGPLGIHPKSLRINPETEIHLQACGRRFSLFGTISGTYQNPPS